VAQSNHVAKLRNC